MSKLILVMFFIGVDAKKIISIQYSLFFHNIETTAFRSAIQKSRDQFRLNCI